MPVVIDRDVGSVGAGVADADDHVRLDRAGPVLGLVLDADRDVQARRNSSPEETDLSTARGIRALRASDRDPVLLDGGQLNTGAGADDDAGRIQGCASGSVAPFDEP